MMVRRFPGSGVGLLSIVLLIPPCTASAAPQQSQTPPRPQTATSKSTPAKSSSWEIDVHGGGALGGQPTNGTGTLPLSGSTYTSPFGGNQTTRAVPSWYFGDGAVLFNAAVPGQVPLVPLDSVLKSSSFERHQSGSIGGRVHYGRAGRRLGYEASVEVASGGPRWTDAALAGIEASRASFITSWSRTFPAAVTSQATIVNGSAKEITWTGGVTVDVVRRGADSFFATGGIGSIAARGEAPSATLKGRYVFNVGNATLDETDTVTLTATRRSVFFWTTGAGWKHQLSPRFGMRADLSAAFGQNNLTMQIHTAPVVVPSPTSPSVFATVGSGSSTIFLSNVPGATGNIQSSLRTSLQYDTFTGDHLLTRVSLTAGIFMRF